MPHIDPTAEFDPLDYHVLADTVISALLQQPQQPLPLPDSFGGAGVYLIYYAGDFKAYRPISDAATPVYVGKAIPSGSRRGPSARQQIEHSTDPALFNRLREHARSIDAARNLDLSDFRCRYLVVTPIWITIAESLLIEQFKPVWNAAVDGFGLHHVGRTRFGQKRSDWDTLHPGRPWAKSMQPGKTKKRILSSISDHFDG